MREVTATDQRGGRRPVLLLAVALVMFGLLAMHALGDHGVSHGATPMDHVAQTSDQAHHGAAVDAEQVSHVAPSHDQHGAMSMAMICMALLIGLGGLLFALVSRRGLLWSLSRHLAAITALPRPSQTLATGPPPVWQFSVIRC